ncbi:hypothetical protein LX16_5269 [Stackebrandtia albiflava]|uniref:Uncharacterized protein n=1 Tax=Stackebrandtia albiflava TaxID=406432 RepID=A0A562UL05_9ACTN|nr:hypothetical protein [Stackebrandtia albiflava]TWJ06305.1 hypothetical protein LX16_5269 [Stackebrandtia albiflava]
MPPQHYGTPPPGGFPPPQAEGFLSGVPAPVYPPPPGVAPSPVSHSPVPVYLSAGLFIVAAVLSYVVAFANWDGTGGDPLSLAAVIGMVFTFQFTGNIDFAISATLTVATTVLAFAFVMLFRLNFARFVLGVVGLLVALYYGYALVYIMSFGFFAGPVLMSGVAFLLWLVAAVMAFLPATGRGMRRRSVPSAPAHPPWQQPPR